jgi:uncharacterized glyoxalase superfamily protein PhnB
MAIHELFVYLCVRDAARAIDFYAQAFDAKEKYRLMEPDGRIGHAELDFGGTTVMLSDEFPDYGVLGPVPGHPASVTIHLHVDDADSMIAQAVQAGATVDMPIADQFYGERSGSVRDPFGHRWNVGHSIEDVAPAEMQRRYYELLKKD